MILGQAQKMIKLAFGGAYASNVKEVKTHRIYDTRYFESTANDATFFTVPIGGAWVAGQKTLNETNMKVSGQLPTGEDMVISHLSVKLIVPMTGQQNDMANYARAFLQILQASYFEFQVANKSYESQFHGACVLPKPICAVGEQVANNEDSMVIGKVLGYGFWDLMPVPIPLGARENFSVKHIVPNNPVAAIASELDTASGVLEGIDATMQFSCRGLSIHKK